MLLMSTVQFLLGLAAHHFITKCIVDHPDDLSLPIVLKDAH